MSEPTTLTEVEEPLQAAPEGTPSEPVVEDYIKLSRTDLRGELLRLEREDADFKTVFEQQVGQKAANKYQPRITAKDREIEGLKLEIERRDMLAMDPKDIEAKFAADPAFAKKYAEVVHAKPPTESQPVDETPRIVAAVNDSIDDARSRGVSEAFIKKVTEKIIQNGYDSPDDAHWTQAHQRLQNDLLNEIIRVKTEVPKPVVTNPELTKDGPNLAKGGHGSSQTPFPTTVRAFKDLPQATQRELVSTPEGMEQLDKLVKGK